MGLSRILTVQAICVSSCICPFRYRLVLCIEKFTKNALTLTTQKSSLAVSLKGQCPDYAHAHASSVFSSKDNRTVILI